MAKNGRKDKILMHNNLRTNANQTDTAHAMKDALSGSKGHLLKGERLRFMHQKDALQTEKQ